MRTVAWMTALCAATAAAAGLFAGPAARLAIAAGMLGPLVAVAVSWLIIERACHRDPARVTGLMLGGFLVKVIGFAVYVILAVKVLGLPVRPFGVSFLCYFVGLYAAEAWLLRRLA